MALQEHGLVEYRNATSDAHVMFRSVIFSRSAYCLRMHVKNASSQVIFFLSGLGHNDLFISVIELSLMAHIFAFLPHQ